MKATKITLALVLATGIVFAAKPAITDTLIQKILAVPMKEVGAKVFGKAFRTLAGKHFEGGAYAGHYVARHALYDEVVSTGQQMDWLAQIEASTILVAQAKEYLHTGDNMKAFYQLQLDEYRAELKKMTAEDRKKLRDSLRIAKRTFSLMELPASQQAFHDFRTASTSPAWEKGHRLLAQNKSAVATAEDIRLGEVSFDPMEVEKKFTDLFEDADLAKFAGRRFEEGHMELLKKYEEVIDLALAEIPDQP